MISPTITDEIEQAEIDAKQQPILQPGKGSLVFDLETGPNTLEHIQSLADLPPPPLPPGEFDPASVKIGNLKDATKIAEKIEAARAAHQLFVDQFESSVGQAAQAFWDDLIEKAPLNPIHGRILAIGFCDSLENVHTLAVGSIQDDDAEADLIEDFWQWYNKTRAGGHQLIGHNIFGFDIPFLIRRSWLLGVDVPSTVMDSNYRYPSHTFVDTRSVWDCGSKWSGNGVPSSLDAIGRAMGEGGKPDGMTGADFWKLFYTKEKANVEKALAYLRNDVVVNSRVARRMGVM